jgi:uncharacterized protein YgiM (DUF1202 family)
MMAKWYRLLGSMGLALAVLTSCNLGKDTDEAPPRPTLGSPIPWANDLTGTPTETATVPASSIPPATVVAAQPTPTAPNVQAQATASPSVQPTATHTVVPMTLTLAPTLTPPSTATPLPPTVTNTPTITRTPFQFPTWTQSPTPSLTPSQLPASTLAPTLTPVPSLTGTFAPPPSFTPVVFSTLTPSYTPLPSAQVCETCNNLRLRDKPGSAGSVIDLLSAGTPVTIVGRTENNAWIQVVLADGRTGWVSADYLILNIDLTVVSVTGTEENGAAEPGTGGQTVVSGVSSHARQIFLDGRAKGNLPHTFTKVGDSISAAPQFLTQIGQGSYQLGDYNYLSGAIGFFSGPNGRGYNPFSTASLAARNGWSTESVLNPANADPNICLSGETPLECEYRLVKPAVALIMLGTNDSGGMPAATFQSNLQTIVQISINMGVIPVLSTIPPKHYNAATDGRVAEFNQIIIATARGYDIPLWDYYQAMASLPNQGLGSDGVHPSTPPSGVTTIFDASSLQYGYTMRNLTALQVLYALWQQVLYDGDQAPAATAPATASAAPVVVPGAPGNLDDPACQGVPPARLTVGGQGRVTPGVPNKLRSAPSTSAEQTGNIPGGEVFSVVGGPQCADGYLWWQVTYNGQTGWTASGTGAEYWVEPYP